jgi:hypothetical protein
MEKVAVPVATGFKPPEAVTVKTANEPDVGVKVGVGEGIDVSVKVGVLVKVTVGTILSSPLTGIKREGVGEKKSAAKASLVNAR